MPLSIFPLPLSPSGPPHGYGWEGSDMSTFSATVGFITGIDARDRFFGQIRCVICGNDVVIQHCHIIAYKDEQLWRKLKTLHWIPDQAKGGPQHEPRNGMLMCANHHAAFDEYKFFIRFFPDIRKFVFVNFSGSRTNQEFHGKAIALDITDRHAPFPSTFIVHEMRVRGYHPFQAIAPAMPDDISWQDWILSDGVFDNETDTFNRDPLPDNRSVPPQLQSQRTITSIGGASSGPGRRTAALNADVISDILAATHAMPSWRACQVEGTNWSGTAEENIQKYVSTIHPIDDS